MVLTRVVTAVPVRRTWFLAAVSGFAASLDLSTLDGSNGFRLDGIDENDHSGGSVSNAGDVNGDGYADMHGWGLSGLLR